MALTFRYTGRASLPLDSGTGISRTRARSLAVEEEEEESPPILGDPRRLKTKRVQPTSVKELRQRFLALKDHPISSTTTTTSNNSPSPSRDLTDPIGADGGNSTGRHLGQICSLVRRCCSMSCQDQIFGYRGSKGKSSEVDKEQQHESESRRKKEKPTEPSTLPPSASSFYPPISSYPILPPRRRSTASESGFVTHQSRLRDVGAGGKKQTHTSSEHTDPITPVPTKPKPIQSTLHSCSHSHSLPSPLSLPLIGANHRAEQVGTEVVVKIGEVVTLDIETEVKREMEIEAQLEDLRIAALGHIYNTLESNNNKIVLTDRLGRAIIRMVMACALSAQDIASKSSFIFRVSVASKAAKLCPTSPTAVVDNDRSEGTDRDESQSLSTSVDSFNNSPSPGASDHSAFLCAHLCVNNNNNNNNNSNNGNGTDSAAGSKNPCWGSLRLVYGILLSLIKSPFFTATVAKKVLSPSFLSELLVLLHSPHSEEREMVMLFFHSVYAKFLWLRPFLMGIFGGFLWESLFGCKAEQESSKLSESESESKHKKTHRKGSKSSRGAKERNKNEQARRTTFSPFPHGVAELLHILSSIASGYVVPLNSQHSSFFFKYIVPLLMLNVEDPPLSIPSSCPPSLSGPSSSPPSSSPMSPSVVSSSSFIDRLMLCVKIHLEKDWRISIGLLDKIEGYMEIASTPSIIRLIRIAREILSSIAGLADTKIKIKFFSCLERLSVYLRDQNYMIAEAAMLLFADEKIIEAVASTGTGRGKEIESREMRQQGSVTMETIMKSLGHVKKNHWNTSIRALATLCSNEILKSVKKNNVMGLDDVMVMFDGDGEGGSASGDDREKDAYPFGCSSGHNFNYGYHCGCGGRFNMCDRTTKDKLARYSSFWVGILSNNSVRRYQKEHGRGKERFDQF